MPRRVRSMRRRHSRGFLLVTCLSVIVLLTLSGSSLMVTGVSETNLSSRLYHRASALQLAEAGISQAALNLKTKDAGDDISSGTLPTGEFQIETQQSLGNSVYEIISRGMSQLETRRLRTYYHVDYQSIFQFAVFGKNSVDLSGEIKTDSYNSDFGLYDPDNHLHNGDIGTNNTASGGIDIDGTSMTIDGQLFLGPGVTDPTSLVTGYTAGVITGGTDPPSNTQDVTTLQTTIPMPPVVVPTGVPCTDQQVNGSEILPLSPTGGPLGNGTYCYHNLNVKGGGAISVSGPVKVYLTGTFAIEGNTLVGEPTDPTRLIFYVAAGVTGVIDGQLGGSSQFYGAIYAPDADIAIGGDAEIYGSIVAEDVYVAGSVQMHYDEAMAQMDEGPQTGTATMTGWEEL